MSTVNKNLFLSLKQDLKNLTSTQEKLLSNFQFFELNSWLYPTKQFWEINKQVESEPECLCYSMLLELIIDKLYVIIHLIIKYVSDGSNGLLHEKLQKNIKCVKLSLGASTELLWKKLESLKQLNNSKTELKPMTLESFTQTANEKELYSEPTIPLLKELVTTLESHKDFSTLKEVKEKLRDNLYDLTEHICVNKLTTGLIEDIKRVTQRRNFLENQNAKIKAKIKDCSLKYKESLKIIDDVDHSLHKFKTMYTDEFEKNKIMIVKLKVLEEKEKIQKNNIKQYEKGLRDLKESVRIGASKIDLLSYDNKTLVNAIDQLKLGNCQLKEETLLWKNRFSDVYLENTNLIFETQLSKEADIFKNALENVNNNCKDFLEKLETFNVGILEKSTRLGNFIKIIVDVADSQMIKEAGQLRQHVSSFIVVGDPISDMRQQITINKATIEELEYCNCKLSEIIKKIQTAAAALKV